jgi:LysR family nitrogen assimilation transcriptional regulator
MEIRQLRYFVRIADLGSFSKASKVLHVAQPALSQQVASLEDELGLLLLARMHNGVKITEQGAIFYSRAQHILKQLDDIKAAVAGPAKMPSGTVTIGLPQSIALRIAMPLLRAIQMKTPGIHLEVYEELSGNILHGLNSGRFDIGVIVNDEDAAFLNSTPLMDEHLLLVSRPDMAPKEAFIELGSLVHLRLAIPGIEQGVRPMVDLAVQQLGLALPRPYVVANSLSIMLRAVQEGMAHSIMPWGAIGELVQSGKLVTTDIRPSMTRRVTISVSKNLPLTTAASAVVAMLTEVTRAQVVKGDWKAVTLL